MANGELAAKQERRARLDDWADLAAAFKPHIANGGLIHAGALSGLNKLIDYARRAGLDPKDMEQEGFIERLIETAPNSKDYGTIRSGLKLLSDFRFIDEVAALLPSCPIPQLPLLREANRLPAHVEAYIDELVAVASTKTDEIDCEDGYVVKKSTQDAYRAVLKYHFTVLTRCHANPQCGYDAPVNDLRGVNDLSCLLEDDHIHATIRYTAAAEGMPGAISLRTSAGYYSSLLIVLARNGFSVGDLARAMKSSRFLKRAKAECKGMTPEAREWCRRLLSDPLMEQKFRNLHRIAQAHANKILDAAAADGRALSDAELREVRKFGTVAAACAIEYAGRPIRLSNVLGGCACRGPRAISSCRVISATGLYGFTLEAVETKACEACPFTSLNDELYGPQVIEWYLKFIRPLFPHSKGNLHLFPSIERETASISASHFHIWFTQVATAVGIPMTFHRWRHGYASLLLRLDAENLQLAADMLNNTRRTVEKHYAFILKSKTYSKGQKQIIESEKNFKKELGRAS